MRKNGNDKNDTSKNVRKHQDGRRRYRPKHDDNSNGVNIQLVKATHGGNDRKFQEILPTRQAEVFLDQDTVIKPKG